MKNNFLKIFTITASLLLFGCQINDIEFEVKADFDVDVNVSTNYSSSALTPVTNFSGTSEIDLTDKIDKIGNILTLEVTGVTLQLVGYHADISSIFTGPRFSAENLTCDLKVELLSNSSNKTLFTGNSVNLGTNQQVGIMGAQNSLNILDKFATPVELTINTTSAKELIENNKVRLKITMANANIRDTQFSIIMKVNSRAITTQ
jgi:hypothetical protein